MVKEKQPASLTAEDTTSAIWYLAATQCFPKDIRERGDLEEEKRILSTLTPDKVLDEIGSLQNPTEKVGLLLKNRQTKTVKHWAALWQSTRPKQKGPDMPPLKE